MTMIKTNSIVSILLAAGIMACLFAAPQSAYAGDALVVVVNSANPVESVSMSELKKLFLSDRSRWETGKAVAPVMLGPGSAERVAFLKSVCGMNDEDFSKYFLQAAFTGKSATPPKDVTSAAALKSFVAASPGAIGFVKASDFGSGDAGIKAVKIDGTGAGEAGYKLKM
jgi:ABC-type phosphate transport system substrate-binding protein